jgi:hypothetical protein
MVETTWTPEAVQAWLANPTNAQSVNLKPYQVRARVNVSANPDNSVKNLLFTDAGKNGTLSFNLDGSIAYMASRRGKGRFPSEPLTVTKCGVTKEGKLHIEIDFQMQGYEVDLTKKWLARDPTLKPTLAPAKIRPTTGGSTSTEIDTGNDTSVSVPVEVAQPQVASAPVQTKTSGPSLATLTDVQKQVMMKSIEMGLYANIPSALASFDQWKNTQPKELG